MFFAGLGQRRDQVLAVGSCIDHVPLRYLRIEQSKTVMVLRCDHDIFHAGFFGQSYPCIGIIFHRIELFGVGPVFGHGNLAALHDPLANSLYLLAFVGSRGNGINAPVNEQAKPRFAKPSHACITLLLSLMSIRI